MSLRRAAILAVAIVFAANGDRASIGAFANDGTRDANRVVHYDALLEPDPVTRSVSGSVELTLRPLARPGVLIMDRGDLDIDAVEAGNRRLPFTLLPKRLHIQLPAAAVRTLTIRYHGAPRSGLVFSDAPRMMYTLFATSEWLVVQDAPDRRATLRLRLLAPHGWTVAATGTRTGGVRLERGHLSEWRLTRPLPTYTFGFVAGEQLHIAEDSGNPRLRFVANELSPDQLRRVFADTADMVAFFASRAGKALPDGQYTQVVAPRTAGQEMAGLSVFSSDYVHAVLADPVANGLIAHEAAHQWWGNMVTCRAWTHFWLNEGIATFMAAAYREHRFGRAIYLEDVRRMQHRYEAVKGAGLDRPLVFPDSQNPTPEDRTLVYQKGGYVLHLLREYIGDTAFWRGLALYTTSNWGRSVTTEHLQNAMERASRRNLGDFFRRWVYSAG